MVRKIMLLVVTAILASLIQAATSDAEQALIDRIKPVAKVCVQGDDCASAAAATASADEAKTPEQIFQTTCFACHGTGAAGAPKLDDKAAWAPRIAQGEDTLLDHALNGFNAMPARGTCGACSDDDIKGVVEYMISQVK
ncbi:c-type cytochrome [Gynuella sunshinyii]|uniref:Cytochrome c5 n=1 Tax=Gynuella sunshinyii YC6258 TaxID=1445510 RepID=A0A0C5VHQ2_9GAMM|nr:cytochrome c5 family protein [Gynuella sunshinyii]AJQ92883.1 cytochrome c5 [Gynuella sunshinyii YC6258]